jgi:hypothetical protein
MDPGKERKAEVFVSVRQIKKVKVVAWLDEREAGGKAVSREKAPLAVTPGTLAILTIYSWKSFGSLHKSQAEITQIPRV